MTVGLNIDSIVKQIFLSFIFRRFLHVLFVSRRTPFPLVAIATELCRSARMAGSNVSELYASVCADLQTPTNSAISDALQETLLTE